MPALVRWLLMNAIRCRLPACFPLAFACASTSLILFGFQGAEAERKRLCAAAPALRRQENAGSIAEALPAGRAGFTRP
jgi:hypothetical protein